MPGPILLDDETEERRDGVPELTLRDRRTGKLRTVRGVLWEVAAEPRESVRTLELWMRDGRRGRLTKVTSLRERRETPRGGDRDSDEPDLGLLTALWMGYRADG